MMRSLFSGVTGLKSHQTKMDVIGNNISNVNTLGFKRSTTNFADLYSETVASASAPAMGNGGINARQIGLGVGVNSIVVKHNPGAAQYTGNPLDLAIEGDGFFVLRTPEGERYSRAGNLSLSANGSLVNPAGYFVQGYGATYVEGTEGVSEILGLDKAAASGYFKGVGYADQAGVWVGNVETDPVPGAPTADPVINVQDGTYTLKIEQNSTGQLVAKIYKNGDLDVTNMFIANNPSGVNEIFVRTGNTPPVPTLPTANTKAAYDAYNTALNTYLTNTGNIASNFAGTTTAPETYYVMIPGLGMMNFQSETTTAAGIVPPTDPNSIQTQISKLNAVFSAGSVLVTNNDHFENDSSIADLRVDPNMYKNAAINEQGALIAQLKENYTDANGNMFAANERVVLGYVSLATFTNNEGLEKVSTNLYAKSSNSGNVRYNVAGAEGAGSLTPSSLEMSNVDLADETVNMITTQRGFQANSRVITTSDSMLEEIVNLKR